MTCPRIEVDLSKIRANTQTLVRRLAPRGIAVTGVNKGVCGHPAIARAMLDGGASGLAEARIENVQGLRAAGLTSPTTLIRTPMMSQVDQVVRSCAASYNTEVAVIMALATAATRVGTVHGIILMVEMGDGRDGIPLEQVAGIAQQVTQIRGVALQGIGANSGCLNGRAPTASQMVALSELAAEVEGVCGTLLSVVSGGGSGSLPWAFGDHPTGRINDLRLGEAILLGVEPLSGDRIAGMHTDAFTLVAEVIETGAKPAPFPIALPDLFTEHGCSTPALGASTRMILALGHQDTDILGLSLPKGLTVIGATSDHLVVATHRPPPPVGGEVKIRMNYTALMHAMAAPDINVIPMGDAPARPSRPSHGRAELLAPA